MRTPRPIAALALLCLAAAPAFSAEPAPFDLVVVEATPGGIAMAVQAAREGLKVALVNHNRHLGGILSSGLGVWDTEFEGRRSPIYDSVRQALFDHYRSAYGPQSQQYRDAIPGKSGHTNGKFEPHVIEKILTDLVAAEPNITLFAGFIPVAVGREGPVISSVEVRPEGGELPLRLRAQIFADCTYEGDLLALARVPYRVGREARSEYGEAHAGVIYMKPLDRAPTPEIARDVMERAGLKLRPFHEIQQILPQSTGAADPSVQAYNYRTILSSDPANRLPVERPANYDPAALRGLNISSVVAPIPNQKICWNRPQLIGEQTAYVEGDWAVRGRVMDRFWNATVGLLYYLQHDPAVPPAVRAEWAPYGLARDEFADNGHRPYEIYVREARRLVGRYVLTEHDVNLAPGSHRAPPQPDSIAFIDWYMDSHSCTTRRVPGGLDEGKTMLAVETFPAQIPYRTLLPRGVDNLLVPVALSATHVAWGAVRLEPVYMEIGEAAGYAAALAIRNRVAPARLDPEALVRRLAVRRLMLAFFNDVDVSAGDPAVAAAEYFAGRGFFAGYDARLNEPLGAEVGRVWRRGLAQLRAGTLDAGELARDVAQAESVPVTSGLPSAAGPTRGQTLREMWAQLP